MLAWPGHPAAAGPVLREECGNYFVSALLEKYALFRSRTDSLAVCFNEFRCLDTYFCSSVEDILSLTRKGKKQKDFSA